ncbi:hypothetical protein RB653_006234 [Dictyostelium firmibasis]|uniref:FNIP repeat-containing protein n=1 Tax=Dictyostelium firmibasis TaxID=79012 RepID=A0AAN7UBP1_9MYCE
MTINQYSTFKYKGYIENLIFVNHEEDSDLKVESSIVKELNKKEVSPPIKLSELIVSGCEDSIFTYSIKTIKFNDTFNEAMNNIKFLDSVKSLEFGSLFNQSLDGGWLPTKIESLKFGISFQQNINNNVLPESLENLYLCNEYKGIIMAGSIPSKVKNLDYTAKLNLSIPIPISTINLKFEDTYNAIIKEGYIPHNVENIEFNEEFNREIKPGSLPPSVRSIKFSPKFNQSIRGVFQVNVLPANLKNLEFGLEFNQPLTAAMLPTSLTSIKFGNNFNPLLSSSMTGLFLHTNLVSLEFGNQFKAIIPTTTLPSKTLTHLNLGGFNENLSMLKDTFNECESLKSLVLENFNQYIKPGDLPSNLTFLSLGSTFDKPIEKDILPFTLKVLEIKNSKYSHQLIQNNLPKSLDKLIIYFGTASLLNNFSVDYFCNKITKIKL